MKKSILRAIFTFAITTFALLGWEMNCYADEISDYISNCEFTEVSFKYGRGDGGRDATGFVYNDGFLFQKNTTLSPELAKMSIGLSAAVYEQSDIENAISQMPDYTLVVEKNFAREHTVTDNDFVRYVIAKKTGVEYNGETYTIFCVPIQGTKSGYDWNSDFNIGSGENHEGFYAAHNEIMCDLYVELAKVNDPAHTIVWTMGHSRGAAVSNIVAGELTAGYSIGSNGNGGDLDFSGLVSPDNIYSYNFAVPNVSKSSTVKNTNFGNIFNFNNKDDAIPTVPLESWGYDRYGVTEYLRLGDTSNVSQRCSTLTGKAYGGTSDTVVYLDSIIEEVFPNANAANSPAATAVFRALALILKGEKSLKDIYESVGFYLSDEGWDIISDMSGNPVEDFNNYIEYVQDLALVMPTYISTTEGMSDDDFAIWVDKNREAVEKMEDIFGYDVSTPKDLISIYALVMADQISNITHVGIDATSAAKVLTVIGELWVYAYGTGGLGGAKDAIFHGHMPATYVWWINSMYCGYYGWYENKETGAAIVDEGIYTIGGYGYSESTVKGIYGLENLKYISSYGFYNCGSLTKIDIGVNLKSIVPYTFYNSSLKELVVESSKTKLEDFAFCNCTNLEKVTIPVEYNYAHENWEPFSGW